MTFGLLIPPWLLLILSLYLSLYIYTYIYILHMYYTSIYVIILLYMLYIMNYIYYIYILYTCIHRYTCVCLCMYKKIKSQEDKENNFF